MHSVRPIRTFYYNSECNSALKIVLLKEHYYTLNCMTPGHIDNLKTFLSEKSEAFFTRLKRVALKRQHLTCE